MTQCCLGHLARRRDRQGPLGTSEFGDVDGVVDQTEDLMATQVGKLSDLAG